MENTKIFQNGIIVMDDLSRWKNTKIFESGLIVMDYLPR
jgi:hypothetical protein